MPGTVYLPERDGESSGLHADADDQHDAREDEVSAVAEVDAAR